MSRPPHSGDVTSGGTPFPSFADAAQAVLAGLRDELGLGVWMISRFAGEDQIVLRTDGPLNGQVPTGSALSWSGSLCAQMVAGNGPSIAPRVGDVPAYAAAANRELLPIEAYVGVPLRRADGELFGTLCGFDPEPQPDSLLAAEPHLLLQARLLATVLDLELGQDEQRRRAERAELDATKDALTGLTNRRGWDQILAAEEARCRRYGHPACVLVLDLNGLKTVNDDDGHAAGDQMLRDCARVLTTTARDSDLVARLGGDEFGLLAVETDRVGGEAKADQLRRAFAEAGLPVAIGLAARSAAGSLDLTWKDADRAMYQDKQASRDTAPAPG